MADQFISIGSGHQQASSWWPNWPIMLTSCVQSVGPGGIDADMAADHNAIIFQSFYPTTTRMQARCDAIDDIWALQDQTKIVTRFFQYLTPAVTYKVLPNPIDNERAFNLELILAESPRISNSPRWKVHRVNQPGDAGLCETLFAPDTDHQVNITAGAGVNSLGEDYATAYWKKYDNTWTQAYKDRLAGIFHDVFNQRPAQLFQNNGATAVNDPDYDNDGIADLRASYGTGPGNGGTQWALGGLNTFAKFRLRFPDKRMIVNGARWDFDYFDSGGDPPPPSQAPFFRQNELTLDESVNSNLSLTPTGTGWNVAGTPGATGRLSAFYRAYTIQEKFLKLESTIGSAVKGAVLMHCPGNNQIPTSADLEVMRFVSLASLLVERASPCTSAGTSRVWTIDEMLFDLGNPVGPRTMGTLNESDMTLDMRDPDFTNGTFGKFFWAIFEKGMVLINGATPSTGVFPSADAAVACTLPSPGAGFKWQRLNVLNYVNPRTGRAMRNQSPTINTGADVGSTISLKPLHAIMLRKTAL